MRNAGDGMPGGSSGRRQRAAEPSATGRPAGNGGASLFTPAYRVRHPATVPGGGQATTQRDGGYGYEAGAGAPGAGYAWPQEGQSASSYQGADYSDGGGYSWMTDDADGSGWPVAGLSGFGSAGRRVGNAIRGFAPVPDEPLPSYPPGPFAAWNRGAGGSAGDSERDYGDGTREGSSRALAAATITPDEFDTDYSLPAIKDPSPSGATTRDGRSADGRGTAGGRAAGSQVAAGQGSGRAADGRSGHGRSSGRSSGSRSAGSRSAGSRRAAAAQTPARSGRSGSARSGRAGSGRAQPKSKRQPVVLAIGTAVVIIVAVAAVLVVTSLGKQNPPTKPRALAKPHPTAAPTPTPPPGKWGFIGTRTSDDAPLTLRELFPASFLTNGVYFHATKMQPGRNCRTALIGAALQAAVHKADCTQDMRASYVARLDNAMATIGVFNLDSAAAASKAALKTGPSAFVTQLPSKNGVTSKIGQGTGLEEAVVKGHYLVLVWAEKIDLTSPKTAWQRGRLTRFMNTLLQDTVNGTLSFRMVEGKPQTPTHTLPTSSPGA
ncbi:MAG TPA: hypothetical protein VFI65_23775 [Streptosporangiaceae bacterium]|nr:hypothetical protein [Streptosporangiaceae bacterium]